MKRLFLGCATQSSTIKAGSGRKRGAVRNEETNFLKTTILYYTSSNKLYLPSSKKYPPKQKNLKNIIIAY